MDIIYGRIKWLTVLILIMLVLLVFANFKFTKNNTNKQEIDTDSEYIEIEQINKEMVIKSFCYAKYEPYDDSESIFMCNIGDKITVLSNLSSGWSKIEACEKEGYVKSDCIGELNSIFVDDNNIVIESVDIPQCIKADEDVQNNIINYASNYWYIIPSNIRSEFIDDGWTIYIISNQLEDILNIDYNILAYTNPDNKTIYIEDRQKAIRKSLIHEIGHYIDIRENYISDNDTFLNIYEKHSKYSNIADKELYNNFSNKEYFAASFQEYILRSTELKLRNKAAYDFFLSLENNNWRIK